MFSDIILPLFGYIFSDIKSTTFSDIFFQICFFRYNLTTSRINCAPLFQIYLFFQIYFPSFSDI